MLRKCANFHFQIELKNYYEIIEKEAQEDSH